MNRLQLVLTIFCISLFCGSINAQNDNDSKEYYLFFDEITGIENSVLHNGIIYEEQHRIKSKKTKFFPKPDFVLGSVVFNDQPYFDLLLKYNVYDDELLFLVDRQLGGKTIQLYKSWIDSFKIGTHLFRKIEDSVLENGFYEISLENSFFYLLKKHRKNLVEQLGKKLVYHEFEDDQKDCFLYYQQKYHAIKRISDLTQLFPEYEEQLISFNKNQKSNADFDSQLEVLLVHLDMLLDSRISKTSEN